MTTVNQPDQMNLYLIQHGQAKPKEEDPERPLSEKGGADVGKVAAFISKNATITVGRILHSGKTRAQQTADILCETLHPSAGVKIAEGLDPLDDPSIWAEKLAQVNEDFMLVGHLPHLSKLASLLLIGDPERSLIAFQMGGAVCLGRDDEGKWSVRWMIVPEILG